MRALAALFLSCAALAADAPSLHDEVPVALPAYSAVPHIERYATEDEYERARRDARFRLTRAGYESGGLTVFAYVYAPVKAPTARLPVVVFNRGSYVWREFAGEYLTTFHRLAEAGFLVVAPMYRGSGGAEGRDELGGADLEDLRNVRAVIARLPHASPDRVFFYGESRGAMMTYQAIRDRHPMRAAAVYGGFTDLAPLADAGGKFAQAATMIWPDYEERRSEIVRRRSAVRWPETFTVPVLIMHGGRDGDVSPSHALALAAKLEELGKEYELVIRAGAGHTLSEWRVERDARAIEWFRRHMGE